MMRLATSRFFCLYCVMVAFLFLFHTSLSAETLPLIQKSGYCLTEQSLSVKSAENCDTYKPFDATHEHLNFGFTDAHVWVKLLLENVAENVTQSVLKLDNPLLEEADLYCHGLRPQHQGLLQRQYPDTIDPAFVLQLAPRQQMACLLHLHNGATTLEFGLHLLPPERFVAQERHRYDTIVFFLGMLLSLAILSLLMYLYARDSSYLLYLFYLATLVFQQVTYTGFLPLSAPLWFNRIDNAIVVPKVALMIIAAALYARAFLRTAQWSEIDRVYRFFIWITLLQIPLVGTPWFYHPEVTVITGLFFVLFNTYAGVAIYRRGYKPARFFVLAWLLLAAGYLVMIFDALGYLSVMYRFPMLIMAMTTLEAILLLLAFVDRFYHYQLQKLAYEQRYNRLLTEQKEAVEREVTRQTAELHEAVEEKETLFRELHHRVKNNLQLILSIVRLQRNRAKQKETREALNTFEQRVATIANTHEILLQEGGMEMVDMQVYLQSLCGDLMEAFSREEMQYRCSSDVRLPLREAVYVGLIVNELVTNMFKHATPDAQMCVTIGLHKSQDFYLLQVDAPAQPQNSVVNSNGLGQIIVKTLAEEQLGGTIETHLDGSESISIRFRA